MSETNTVHDVGIWLVTHLIKSLRHFFGCVKKLQVKFFRYFFGSSCTIVIDFLQYNYL